jgi:hypothetical protein
LQLGVVASRFCGDLSFTTALCGAHTREVIGSAPVGAAERVAWLYKMVFTLKHGRSCVVTLYYVYFDIGLLATALDANGALTLQGRERTQSNTMTARHCRGSQALTQHQNSCIWCELYRFAPNVLHVLCGAVS